MGGGFGIPYNKQSNQPRLDLKELGWETLGGINSWVLSMGRYRIKIEPGRYIVAESGILLGKVNAVKTNYNIKIYRHRPGF